MAEYIGQCIDLDTIYSDITTEDCELMKNLLSDNFSGFRSFIMVRMILLSIHGEKGYNDIRRYLNHED